MKKIKRKTINTESSEDVTHTNILKKEKGITLIALVVTIVVLLILAGVSINLVIGNNGIITKSKEARIVTRADNAEDEVELWKNNNYIAKNSNGSSESKNDMLQRLIDKKLVYEDEIDRNNEIITIKREDGTIVKEINYGGVVIHISKTPETEKSGAVVLQVTSVEGLTNISIKSEEEIFAYAEEMDKLDKENQKELIRELSPEVMNKQLGTNLSTFSEVVQYYYDNGQITENTEEAFFSKLDSILAESEYGYGAYITEIMMSLFYNNSTGEMSTYKIINPDNELSNVYTAKENGTYTFTVKDLLTGKTYTKSVEVTNIDSTLQQYYVANIGEYNEGIGLLDDNTGTPTTFEQAFIIYNGEKIDITSIIRTSEDNSCNYLYGRAVANYIAYGCNKATYRSEIQGNRVFILVKDGIDYVGCALVYAPPEV